MSGSTFQREAWEISRVIHLPDSVLAITEQGGGEKAAEEKLSGTKSTKGGSQTHYGLLARAVNGTQETGVLPRPAVDELANLWLVTSAVSVASFPYPLLFRCGLVCRLDVSFRCCNVNVLLAD